MQLAVNKGVECTAELFITAIVFDTAFTFLIFTYGPLPIRKFQTHNSNVLPKDISVKCVVHAEMPAF